MRLQIGDALSKHIKTLMDKRKKKQFEAIKLKNKQAQTPWMNLSTDPAEKLQEIINERVESNHPSSQDVSEAGNQNVKNRRKQSKKKIN